MLPHERFSIQLQFYQQEKSGIERNKNNTYSLFLIRYGPFWICTTLMFVAAAIGTFVTYLAHKWQKKDWNYDINLVTWSAGLFYGYVTVVPLGLYLILKYFSAPSGLVQLFCLYGYSLFVFIPASVRKHSLYSWLYFFFTLLGS